MLAGLTGVLALALAPAAASGVTSTIPAGYDLFVTDPGTSFGFTGDFSVPAGFFDPASAPFSGTVDFRGEPIGEFGGHAVGDADTIVQRLEAAEPPATVPIEIVELNLASVEPITVQVGTGMQLWDVHVDLSPARPSHGSMTITKTGEEGGTFSSQLLVLPRFTFVRESDGATRTLDLGTSLPAGSAGEAAITLKATGVWRAGCVYPALAVAGLNDGFCPGLTEDGQKQLTVEEALLARHGVYPAQPAPDHFKCYRVGRTSFKTRSVSLADQFGASLITVKRPRTLCNPVQKNSERIVNPAAHLKCYAIQAGDFTPRDVLVANQFGSQELRVLAPKTLCLPSTKKLLSGKRLSLPRGDPSQLGDHYQCYSVSGSLEQRVVRLRDQFHVERVRVLRPIQLCNPVSKNGEPLLHPLRHLTCYAIEDVRRTVFSVRRVRVTNQFGVEVLRVIRPYSLCVPSTKTILPEQPPPEQPPTCSGAFTSAQGAQAGYQFTCTVAVVSFLLLVPSEITSFTPPAGLTCALHTTTTQNDSLVCQGAVPGGTPVTGTIQTSPDLGPELSGQLYVNTDAHTQYGPFQLTGPPPGGNQ